VENRGVSELCDGVRVHFPPQAAPTSVRAPQRSAPAHSSSVRAETPNVFPQDGRVRRVARGIEEGHHVRELPDVWADPSGQAQRGQGHMKHPYPLPNALAVPLEGFVEGGGVGTGELVASGDSTAKPVPRPRLGPREGHLVRRVDVHDVVGCDVVSGASP
jgi:hypothetical protein